MKASCESKPREARRVGAPPPHQVHPEDVAVEVDRAVGVLDSHHRLREVLRLREEAWRGQRRAREGSRQGPEKGPRLRDKACSRLRVVKRRGATSGRPSPRLRSLLPLDELDPVPMGHGADVSRTCPGHAPDVTRPSARPGRGRRRAPSSSPRRAASGRRRPPARKPEL